MILKKNTDMFQNKGKIIITVYIILSLMFIAISFYENFKQNYAQTNFERGSQFAFAQVIERASQGCDPFAVNLGEARVDLINVACFQNTQQQEGGGAVQTGEQSVEPSPATQEAVQ